MSIIHVNAKGKTYYLHQGTTKTGKPKYHFSPKSEGNLVEAIPEGFEIYEHPNAQVFLRRILPRVITDEERQVVEDGMRKYADVSHYKIDVKGNAIMIYTAAQNMGALFDEEKVTEKDPEEFLQALEPLKAIPDTRQRFEEAFDFIEQKSHEPLPEVEKFPVYFYDEGITSFETALKLRQLLAFEHWRGNTAYTFGDMMKKIIPGL